MVDFSPTPDENVHFLITCIEATPINIDFHGVATHMGTSVSIERERYATLAGRVSSARADHNATTPRATFTGANVPVNDQYFYLLMGIELYGQRPHFGRVAAINGTSTATARMRFTRLSHAIHERLAAESDSE